MEATILININPSNNAVRMKSKLQKNTEHNSYSKTCKIIHTHYSKFRDKYKKSKVQRNA